MSITLPMMMTSNDCDMEQKGTLSANDQEESEAKQKYGLDNVKFFSTGEIEDTDAELMDSSINSVDVNRKSSGSRIKNHVLESFALETQGYELIETKQLQEKGFFFGEIQNELLHTANDAYLVASNSLEMKANSTAPKIEETSNSLTDENSSIHDGSTQLTLAPEKNSSFSTVEEPRVLDTEDLKALPLVAPTASSNHQCSSEQTWPSSQENTAMFEVSEQNLPDLSTKSDLHLPSIESTAVVSSSVANYKARVSLSQATETDQNICEIEENTIISTSNEYEHTAHIETQFGEKSLDHKSTDFSKRRIPTSNTITPINNTSCSPLKIIDNNARASSVLPQEIDISTPKKPELSRETEFLSKKAQILSTSRNQSTEVLFPLSSLSRPLLTPAPPKTLEATLVTSTNSSMITQANQTDKNNLSPSIQPPRTHSAHDSFGSSPSSSVSTGNLSSPMVSESSPERAKEILLTELKTIKIASITARNTALEAELASKRARLREITRELKAPAQETVRRHIKLLHDYNDIRDIGQGLIGMIAEQRGVQIGSLYEDYGIGVKD